MKHALISPYQPCMSYDKPPAVLGPYVVEVAPQPFEVAEPLFWEQCDDAVTAYQFYWNGSGFSEIPLPPVVTDPDAAPTVA